MIEMFKLFLVNISFFFARDILGAHVQAILLLFSTVLGFVHVQRSFFLSLKYIIIITHAQQAPQYDCIP